MTYIRQFAVLRQAHSQPNSQPHGPPYHQALLRRHSRRFNVHHVTWFLVGIASMDAQRPLVRRFIKVSTRSATQIGIAARRSGEFQIMPYIQQHAVRLQPLHQRVHLLMHPLTHLPIHRAMHRAVHLPIHRAMHQAMRPAMHRAMRPAMLQALGQVMLQAMRPAMLRPMRQLRHPLRNQALCQPCSQQQSQATSQATSQA